MSKPCLMSPCLINQCVASILTDWSRIILSHQTNVVMRQTPHDFQMEIIHDGRRLGHKHLMKLFPRRIQMDWRTAL